MVNSHSKKLGNDNIVMGPLVTLLTIASFELAGGDSTDGYYNKGNLLNLISSLVDIVNAINLQRTKCV